MVMEHERTAALIDARGRDPTFALDDLVARHGAPALVVTDTLADAARLVEAGATHFLVAPASEELIALGLRAAAPERRTGQGGETPELAALHRWLAGRLAAGRSCAVVVVALSRIDLVNAAHGRDTTEAAITGAAERIVTAAGPHAILARTAGSRFLLGLEDEAAAPLPVESAIERALARPIMVEDAAVMLGSRIGIARAGPVDDPEALIRRAYEALAGARAGEATVQVAGPDGVAPIEQLAIDLHHALAAEEIDIVFQPQVEIATGRIVGVEALARWSHRRLGPLGAEELFAAAERADLGIALSDHIQRLTLTRAAAWPRPLGTLRLSLNLTAADVTRAGFARLFLDRVDASGFPRGRLTVEVTETGMIQHLDRAAALLAELRGAGCRVAIDDFGTGYSSLAYLKALPLDYVKIDRALVVDIAGSPRDRVVVRGVIDIAHALGLAVIAEGVETPAQLALLAAEGCGWYQGFLRAGPLDEAMLLAMVEER
jgi:EAL domain-containing protein (putative c-di-GMP-specific phosphodiesterase class I)/GGDEF domain-containing protein